MTTVVDPKGPAAQGAGSEHLDDGQGTAGAPKLPTAPANEPPTEKEGLNEELGLGGKPKPDAAAEKAAAEKKVADDAAAKAAADAAAEAAKTPAAPVEVKEYISLEDPAGQAAIDLLKEAGVSPTDANSIFAKAVESGNLEDVDVDALVAKVGQTKATLIMAGVTDYHTRQSAQDAASIKSVHDILGGEANWNTVRDWAQVKEKTDPAFKHRLNQVREMLNKGGLYAESAGRELVRMYGADPSTKGLGNSVGLTSGDTFVAPVGQSLTRADYVTELKKAHARGASQVEINALYNRRKAGKAAGI